jgi:hypothetical protein
VAPSDCFGTRPENPPLQKKSFKRSGTYGLTLPKVRAVKFKNHAKLKAPPPLSKKRRLCSFLTRIILMRFAYAGLSVMDKYR